MTRWPWFHRTPASKGAWLSQHIRCASVLDGTTRRTRSQDRTKRTGSLRAMGGRTALSGTSTADTTSHHSLICEHATSIEAAGLNDGVTRPHRLTRHSIFLEMALREMVTSCHAEGMHSVTTARPFRETPSIT